METSGSIPQLVFSMQDTLLVQRETRRVVRRDGWGLFLYNPGRWPQSYFHPGPTSTAQRGGFLARRAIWRVVGFMAALMGATVIRTADVEERTVLLPRAPLPPQPPPTRSTQQSSYETKTGPKPPPSPTAFSRISGFRPAAVTDVYMHGYLFE